MSPACLFCNPCGQQYAMNACPASNANPCGPCIKARQLEARIAKARKTLDELLEEHRTLRSQMNEIHDPVTSLLPVEISSTIFQACLPGTRFHPFVAPGNAREDAFTTPWTIGAVCRKWRNIAWSSPSLWNAINVDVITPPANIEKVRSCLERAGQLPLAIRIHVENPTQDKRDSLHDLARIIKEHASRWEHLDLRMPLFLLTNFVRDSAVASASGIRTLHLQCPASSPLAAGILSFQNTLPCPKEVDLQYVSFSSVDINWSEATHTRFRRIQVSECLRLFKEAVSLKECTLSDVFVGGETSEGAITHSGLETFVLENSDKSMDALLHRVLFPGLKSLTLLNFNRPLPPDIVSSFLQVSACHLQELIITRTSLPSGSLIPFLKDIPSLERLELEPGGPSRVARHSPDRVFEALGRTAVFEDLPHAEYLLPKLKFLRYTHRSGGINWAFVPLIFGPLSMDSQQRARRPLHTVQICVDQADLGGQYTYLDHASALSCLAVLKPGLRLEIGDTRTGMDLIQMSMLRHGMI